MTPDDRAAALVRQLVEDLGLADHWPESERGHLLACMARPIARAIREAREEAIEEAAKLLQAYHDKSGRGGRSLLVEEVRALKSE